MEERLFEHLSGEQLEQIGGICERYRVERLYLFGSVLTGDYRTDSDVDLLVCFKDMELLDYADNYFDFLTELQAILDRPVDLVIEKDLSNPVLIESINESKKLIYGREEDTKVVA